MSPSGIRAYLRFADDARKQFMQKTGGVPGWQYRGYEDFVLQHGKDYVSQPLTKKERAYLEDLIGNFPPLRYKECFYNAQLLNKFLCPFRGSRLDQRQPPHQDGDEHDVIIDPGKG